MRNRKGFTSFVGILCYIQPGTKPRKHSQTLQSRRVAAAPDAYHDEIPEGQVVGCTRRPRRIFNGRVEELPIPGPWYLRVLWKGSKNVTGHRADSRGQHYLTCAIGDEFNQHRCGFPTTVAVLPHKHCTAVCSDKNKKAVKRAKHQNNACCKLQRRNEGASLTANMRDCNETITAVTWNIVTAAAARCQHEHTRKAAQKAMGELVTNWLARWVDAHAFFPTNGVETMLPGVRVFTYKSQQWPAALSHRHAGSIGPCLPRSSIASTKAFYHMAVGL